MCGIFGYFNTSGKPLTESLLNSMGKVIEHRGPDDFGLFVSDQAALGNVRLSVMDIDGGHQPFVSDDNNVVVVQNGEIFNHVELAEALVGTKYECRTTCDTEVILRLYEKEGIDFIHELNGMFSIAIYDKKLSQIFLIRDRIGIKPLYYYEHEGLLLFSSEIKSLLAAGIAREMDFTALDQFLSLNYVPPPRTMFKGVRHVMPGTYLSVSESGKTTERWWNLTDQRAENRTEAEWIYDFNQTLRDAVSVRLRSDVPFGAFLSGGVDSSSVVGLMSDLVEGKVKTFSIGFHEKEFDESPYAQAAAERFNTDHLMEKVDPNLLGLWPMATWYCDQPHGDVSFMPTYRVAELASRDVTVVLTGDGADELFAGYDKYLKFFSSDYAQIEESNFREEYYKNISLFSDELKQDVYGQAWDEEEIDQGAMDILNGLFDSSSHMDRINQALYIDMMLLLPGNNLVKPDRMGMAVSLEARAPFLDYRMMELAFRMPGEMKLYGGETKYIYKKAVRALIGDDLAYRKKQMFTVPVGEWFKEKLAPFTESVLLSERALSRKIFDEKKVKSILCDHQSGEKNYTREIRAMISVELWARIFLDRCELTEPSFGELGIDPGLV